MTRRYYAPDLPADGGVVVLSPEESQHAIRVMRVEVGDHVTLFDGCGHEAEASVIRVGKKECELQAQPPRHLDREPRCAIHLAVALPKPDRSKELIERLTELGVRTLTPLVAERTQRPPTLSLLEKLRRGVTEACKQSERNQLMEIHEPKSSLDFLREPGDGVRWIAHPAPDAILVPEARSLDHVTAAVGPEGGWSETEYAAAMENGYQPIHLGKRIYRIETAATVIAAMLAD
jgi:16S rRNA (uracil1498-N3)-methyltransferase